MLVLRGTTPEALATFVVRQLSTFFPDAQATPVEAVMAHLGRALERTHLCFSGIARSKFREGDSPMFNYQHPDHYAMFLYLLANTLSRAEPGSPLAFRLYYLNKVLHSLDAYPDIALPEVFQFMHPVGTILGHARYGNYFCVYQGCSVGSDEDGAVPEFGDHVVLYAGASVIGNCRIGSNVVIGAKAQVLNCDVPDDRIVVQRREPLELHINKRHVLARRFRQP